MSQYSKYCGFCGKPAAEVERLLDGPTVAICNECITLMHGMLDTPPSRDFITLEEFRIKHGLPPRKSR